MKKTLAALSLAVLVGIATHAAPSAAGPPSVTAPAPRTLPLLHQADLRYAGAFLLPEWRTNETSFSYGGTALAFNPANHSLFVVGHDWYQQTAEVTIPPLVKRANLKALKRATFLQQFADATNGTKMQAGDGGIKIGGQLVYQGHLYGTVYVYYDATGSQVFSHWLRPTTSLTAGQASGLYQIGSSGAGMISGYLAEIPSAWRGLLGGPALTGNCCLPIISRTSYGPAAFVFDPAALGAVKPVPDTPLVYYPAKHPAIGGWSDSWNPGAGILFNGSTTVRGLVFPEGSRSLLFFGTQGTGPFCYGEGSKNPADTGKPVGDGAEWCYDPDAGSKGVHGYPYVATVWAYDANDLLAVKKGQKRPWSVRPYATWTLKLPFPSPQIGGATYDAGTGTIYVSQQFGNGTDPVIVAFKTR